MDNYIIYFFNLIYRRFNNKNIILYLVKIFNNVKPLNVYETHLNSFIRGWYDSEYFIINTIYIKKENVYYIFLFTNVFNFLIKKENNTITKILGDRKFKFEKMKQTIQKLIVLGNIKITSKKKAIIDKYSDYLFSIIKNAKCDK